MANEKKTCRIYKDTLGQWSMVWYVDNSASGFRSQKGKSKKALIRQAKEAGFTHYYDGYSSGLRSL